jgi:hypothetical protein
MTGWDVMDLDQQAAAKAAARLIEDARLTFVMMLFRDDSFGAVISNIDPPNAVGLIEQALRAARSQIGIEEIDGRETLQ